MERRGWERYHNSERRYGTREAGVSQICPVKQDSSNEICTQYKESSRNLYLSGCVSSAKYFSVGYRSMRLVGSSTTLPAASLPGQRKIPGTLIPPSQPPIAFPPTGEGD